MPAAAIARWKPRLLITVTTTVSSTSSPASRSCNAASASKRSPSTTLPRWSTAITRSPSPSKASPMAAPRSTTAAARPTRRGRPATFVDVAPVGRVVDHDHVGAERERTPPARHRSSPRWRSRARPATRPATACRSPDGRRTAERRATWSSRSAWGRRAAYRPSTAPSAASIDDSTPSVSFVPPAAKIFTPLSPHGLCDAVMTAAGTPRCCDQYATAGVGTTPRSTTSPSTPAPNAGGKLRARRAGVATDEPSIGRQHRRRGTPEGSDERRGQLGERDTAHTIGAEAQ